MITKRRSFDGQGFGMQKNVAIFSGRFNPPGLGHQLTAIELAKHFDEVIVVPCGPRPEKPLAVDIPPFYRAALVDLAFGQLPRVTVDLFDMEAGTFSRTHELQQRYQDRGQLWHVVGTTMVTGGAQGKSLVHTQWEFGPRLWEELNFVVLDDGAQTFDPADLPPHHCLIRVPRITSGANLRQALYNRENLAGQIDDNVLSYINRHQLYAGVIPCARGYHLVECHRPLLVVDHRNPKALELAASFPSECPASPDFIIAIGGDGTMLHAIRQHWRKRVPFYGINTGHLGFLLNDRPLEAEKMQQLLFEHLPLLHVELEGPDGHHSALAFNDAWVERASGQTAHIEVTVDNQVRLPCLVGDGVLVSTAAGSTSYARAMGAMPIPLDSQTQLLVGSNVLDPAFFRPVVLPLASQVGLRTLEPDSRPLNGFIDGHAYGPVTTLSTRLSNIASVELLFDPACDAAEKLARIQFPR